MLLGLTVVDGVLFSGFFWFACGFFMRLAEQRFLAATKRDQAIELSALGWFRMVTFSSLVT